jgi:hypothetical protein
MSLPSKAVSLVVAEPYYDGFNNHWAEAALMQFCAKLAEVQPFLASGFKVVSHYLLTKVAARCLPAACVTICFTADAGAGTAHVLSRRVPEVLGQSAAR